jgi:hypothetical protein
MAILQEYGVEYRRFGKDIAISTRYENGGKIMEAKLEEETKKRRGNPRWLPGQSGNPSGRSKDDFYLQRLARQKTEKALSVLVSIASDKQAPAAARVTAASAILDRGWGRPKMEVDTNVNVSIAATYASQLMELADRASNARVINDMSNIVEDDMLLEVPVELEPEAAE